jgi:hypothetical protein
LAFDESDIVQALDGPDGESIVIEFNGVRSY